MANVESLWIAWRLLIWRISKLLSWHVFFWENWSLTFKLKSTYIITEIFKFDRFGENVYQYLGSSWPSKSTNTIGEHNTTLRQLYLKLYPPINLSFHCTRIVNSHGMCLWTQHKHNKFMIPAGLISCIFQKERRKYSKRDIDSKLCLWINAQHAYHRLITIFIQNVVLSASPAWSCHSDIKSHISGRNQSN